MQAVFTCEGFEQTIPVCHGTGRRQPDAGKGRIYGLVGNNGGGKTTLMRLIVGLGYPDSGKMTLLGESTPKGLREARRRVGAFIETPIYNGSVSGRANLEILCTLYGVKDRDMPRKMLEPVGLSDRGRQPVRHYSLGQRLGLAGAFAIQSELLVLDEPLNGLDPAGTKEVRELLLRLRQEQGATMLISSHNLAQLNLLATDYIILHRGRVVEEITGEELARQCRGYLSLRLEPGQGRAAYRALKDKWDALGMEQVEDEIQLRNYEGSHQALYDVLTKANVEVESLEPMGLSLEEYFIRLTR